MSVEAVVARIGQILAMQQQLVDPQPVAAAGVAGTGGASTAAGGSPSFSDALASAQGGWTASPAAVVPGAGALTGAGAAGALPGATGATGAGGLTGLVVPGGAVAGGGALVGGGAIGAGGSIGAGGAQVQAMIAMADSLLGKPYVWGGGHGGFGPSSGYDCSGFVSAVLHAGGYLSQPQTTDTLPGQPGILPGPGQFVTIYDRPDGSVPGAGGHVIIDIDGQFYESGGETGPWGGGGGVAKIATPTAAYLATFPTVLHPSGL